MDWVNVLIRNKAFWAALLALVNVVLFAVWPTFPKEIWASFDALAMAVFAAYATKEARSEVRQLRVARALRARQ